MSTDFTIKPVGPPVAPVVVQPKPASVAIVAASGGAASNPGATSDDISHEVTFDRDAQTFVYQSVDSLTNLVVQQFPDDAVLRRRAYFHTLDLTKGEPTRPLATDLKA
jgi:hypothetical protein